jgi:dienelactone hydrolase
MRPLGGILAGAFVLALTFAGIYYCWKKLPIFTLPRPQGPYAIGTATFYLVDQTRNDWGATPGSGRHVIAQAWYPADEGRGTAARYGSFDSFPWRTKYLAYIRTHAHVDARPVTGTRWPVVFYSPGAGGFRNQNTALVEHLVSHGYVVVTIDHPGTSARVAFPGGPTIHNLPNLWLNLSSKLALAASSIRTERILQSNVADIQFVFDQFALPRPAPGLERLASVMDLSRVAATGFSFGGAAAAELCRIDKRFHAGVDLDGLTFNGVNQYGVHAPVLFLYEGDPIDRIDPGPFADTPEGVRRQTDAACARGIAYAVQHCRSCAIRLLNADHASFSDSALLQKVLGSQTDRISLNNAAGIVNSLVLSYLNEHLKQQHGELQSSITQNSPYIETACGNAASLTTLAEQTSY